MPSCRSIGSDGAIATPTEESLANLRRIYAGAAAEDFLSQWDRTTEALERYLQGARDIKEILEARLSTLREADRPGDAG